MVVRRVASGLGRVVGLVTGLNRGKDSRVSQMSRRAESGH